MRILLIDADSTIPNLAIMKLAAYHHGDQITTIQLRIPYYTGRKKLVTAIDTSPYDRVYCSVVFSGNANYVKGSGIIFGGTGVDLTTNLPPEIDKMQPDYSIYPDNDVSYGFLTRGCIRNCYFCVVPQKEGKIRKETSIEDIIRHKKISFMDNNILAYEKHKPILKKLGEMGIKCQFNQGLDLRLIDGENSDLLRRLNYWGEYTFAFDSWADRDKIEEKLGLLSWRKDWQVRMFVYVHPDMDIWKTKNRVEWCRERNILPYIMRDIACWGSPLSGLYADIAAWANQPGFFKKLSFEDFIEKRHNNPERRNHAKGAWNANGN